MKCPICEEDMVLNEHFERERNEEYNIRGVGANLGRVIFDEPADTHDFLSHRWDCPAGHTFYQAERDDPDTEEIEPEPMAAPLPTRGALFDELSSSTNEIFLG